MNILLHAVWLAPLALVMSGACHRDPGGSALVTTGTTTAGSGGAPQVHECMGGLMFVGCPAEEPTVGASCLASIACEFGDDPIVACRRTYDCVCYGPSRSNSSWQHTSSAGCVQPPTTTCPNAPEPDAACTTEASRCDYADGTECGCVACSGAGCSSALTWLCVPPPDAPCPPVAPNVGQTCGAEPLDCTYGSCAVGTASHRVCSGAPYWRDEPVICPP